MNLIEPSFEIIEQAPDIEGLYKHIELCGRVCYKSEDKITEDSAKAFVDKVCKAKHGSVLEHGAVYLAVEDASEHFLRMLNFYRRNKYSKETDNGYNTYGINTKYFITSNYRVLKENDRLDDLQYMCEPTEFHEKRVSVRFICSRAISHELVRHRTFSFSQESQRYCNYSKNKFGNGITFIKPLWFKGNEDTYFYNGIKNTCNLLDSEIKFLDHLNYCENTYIYLLNSEHKPEEAREVLPNSTKTELIMSGFVSDWKQFFELRTADNAHPEMRRLIVPLKEEFIKRGYI